MIISARTSEQLADNLGAADLALTAEELALLEAVSRPPLLYPLLAPGQDRRRPARPGRPLLAQPPPDRLMDASGESLRPIAADFLHSS